MRLNEQPQKPVKSWLEQLKALAIRALGEKKGKELWQKYHVTFTADYQDLIAPRYALKDILQLEQLLTSQRQSIGLIKSNSKQSDYRLHFYCLQQRYLDEFIPVLENMYLRVVDQVQFIFTIDGVTATVKSFTVKSVLDEFACFNNNLLETIQSVMEERVENDELNKLCIMTGMHWQAIDVLRAYRNYYLLLGHRTSRVSFHRALINNPDVALGLFNYFEARFKPNPEWDDPVFREECALFPLRLQLLASIDTVSDIHADRILRIIFNIIDATVRTNFYQRRLIQDYFIAIKINSLGVIDMPAPKPQSEIYVHAADMEGIHLRSGKISRGGIRWSDRLDDFRTEILGLMQTQISKNALIVPTGAKGGFVVKTKTSKQNLYEAGKQAYTRLIKGMLDLTDNYCDGSVVNPAGLVIYDDPDPYLVVAADKGTAKFSDIANAIAAEYQFWLHDAFASGGSRGYDHKALGITARGAWECVKRHFREAGKDIQREVFTVIGIGSMDGDVFGNGMLRSRCISLLAAFSGQHIFIDPKSTDLNAAFTERKRLFELPGSTWDDYDRNLISEGGGVYLRAAKDIPVSPELKKWLGIRYNSIDGESLIRFLLTAQADLLWLGGIGTYVKATTEKNEEVGDRINDNVRVDAGELSVKVVGEGANLGFTQKARIEYSQRGGRINTDAVDNSAGVDTSDHEVNLKILLTGLQKKQLISDYQSLFMDMTDAVCRQVLNDNIKQSLCLSLDQIHCADNPMLFIQIAEVLESSGFLDRDTEAFAQTKEILVRPGQIISRPELADLMAAAKMYLTHHLQQQTGLLQDSCYDRYLQAYFPDQILSISKDLLAEHPLAKEIKATVISNKIIKQAGCGFLSLTKENENGGIVAIVSCYLAFDIIFQADTQREAIHELDNLIKADLQHRLLNQIEKTLLGFCRWSVANNRIIRPDLQTVELYRSYLSDYQAYDSRLPCGRKQDLVDQYQQAGITETLARYIVFIANCQDFPFIVAMTAETGQDFTMVLGLLSEINETLGLTEIRQKLAGMPIRDRWEKMVVTDLLDDIQDFTGQLLKQIFSSDAGTYASYFEQPVKKQRISQYRRVYLEVQNSAPNVLLPYVILLRALKNLIER